MASCRIRQANSEDTGGMMSSGRGPPLAEEGNVWGHWKLVDVRLGFLV